MEQYVTLFFLLLIMLSGVAIGAAWERHRTWNLLNEIKNNQLDILKVVSSRYVSISGQIADLCYMIEEQDERED
ncbi:MAG: hypothetical protein KAS32_08580 [Candidatus Peribacteraceae bacterium]|nr:hypothetical protein [Candidatus Peribacteraceae bacterium]